MSEDLINSSNFFNIKQKQYAIDLYRASLNEDFSTLVEIKNSFLKDVKSHPELEIFNIGIAMIDVSEVSVLQRAGCQRAATISATVSGVAGMISGAIGGGLSGAVIGGVLTGGTMTIPAGGAGAVVGAVYGGVSGYASGYALGWLACKIFG